MRKPAKKSTGNPEQQGDCEYNKNNKNQTKVKEIGGFDGPEPTRYGDWEKKGRCYDF